MHVSFTVSFFVSAACYFEADFAKLVLFIGIIKELTPHGSISKWHPRYTGQLSFI
jgi:hypothetical protein